MAPGYYVGGYASGHPVMLPMIDVVEVGAGGGSIAWLDDVGALKVGPQSAGADPGPICYRGGGSRADHHRRQRGARPARPRQFPRRRDEARCRRRAARHQGEDRRPAEAGRDRGRAGDRRDRDRQDVARRARGLGREGLRSARLRAGGVGRRRPAARGRDRARAAHPEGRGAAVPVAFLGARHAAGRRAARLHPHVLFAISRAWISATLREHSRRDGRRKRRRACATPHGAEQQIHLDLRYVGQEFTLQVPVELDADRSGRSRRHPEPPSMRSTSTATPTIRPTSRSRWSISGSAMIGKRPKLSFPRLAEARAPKPSRQREVYFSDARKAVPLPGLPARDARRRQRRSRAPR